MPTDTERLNWLESLADGWSLKRIEIEWYQDPYNEGIGGLRKHIDAEMEAEKRRPKGRPIEGPKTERIP